MSRHLRITRGPHRDSFWTVDCFCGSRHSRTVTCGCDQAIRRRIYDSADYQEGYSVIFSNAVRPSFRESKHPDGGEVSNSQAQEAASLLARALDQNAIVLIQHRREQMVLDLESRVA
jgi:hypothetical protein